MKIRRAIIGSCLLCALLASLFAVQGASAAGTTGYTCVKGKGELRGEHCLTSGTAPAEYGHVAVPVNTTTEGTVTNETTSGVKDSGKLKATIAGVAITLTATGANGSGWGTNAEEGGEMFAHGEGTTTFTGVTATGSCKVFTDSGAGKGEEGVIHTEPLKATSKGQGDSGKLEPKEGTVFARFILEGCVNSGINGTYTVTGSIKPTTLEGSTVSYTHANTTEQNTLRLNGTIKAGVEIATTGRGRANASEAYTPGGATT
ncbi:MAG TPA: hypothetical protein VFX45_12190 [Solirubrobacterales bacterium]|nr:hypothetical protein [Solirubrobacterales bacterium]